MYDFINKIYKIYKTLCPSHNPYTRATLPCGGEVDQSLDWSAKIKEI